MADPPGVDSWTTAESAFDRVRSVAVTLTQPRSADWIAERAEVAGYTARSHLRRLVEMNVLEAVSDRGATRYRPDPLSTRIWALRDVIDGRDRDDLVELRADLLAQLEAWQAEYDADSPVALRAKAGRTGTAERTRALRRTANDWEIVQYRLGLVEGAIDPYCAT